MDNESEQREPSLHTHLTQRDLHVQILVQTFIHTHTNAMTNIHTGQTCSVCNTNNYDEMREVRKRQEEYWR